MNAKELYKRANALFRFLNQPAVNISSRQRNIIERELMAIKAKAPNIYFAAFGALS